MEENDPVENFEKINNELKLYSSDLMKKLQIVAATKLDIKGDGKRLDRLAHYCKDKSYDFYPICSVTGEGLKELTSHLAKKVAEHKGNKL
jgi:GTP-binding protein